MESVEDFLPDFTSASGTRLEVSPDSAMLEVQMAPGEAYLARVQWYVDVRKHF